jgi:hypothetical protein
MENLPFHKGKVYICQTVRFRKIYPFCVYVLCRGDRKFSSVAHSNQTFHSNERSGLWLSGYTILLLLPLSLLLLVLAGNEGKTFSIYKRVVLQMKIYSFGIFRFHSPERCEYWVKVYVHNGSFHTKSFDTSRVGKNRFDHLFALNLNILK